jgi:hypothetical protein
MQLGNFHVAWNAPLPCTRLPGNAATSGVILGWYIGSDGGLLGEVKQPSTPTREGFGSGSLGFMKATERWAD